VFVKSIMNLPHDGSQIALVASQLGTDVVRDNPERCP
jgi:hypothetical protein